MNKKMLLIIAAAAVISVAALTFWKNGTFSRGDSLEGIAIPKAPAKTAPAEVDADIVLDEEKWTTNFTHDASIIKADGFYYAFSTDYMIGAPPKPGIQIRKSKDMINWKFAGRAFDQMPLEAVQWTNGGSTYWAPDIVEMNDRYYLYYSVSQVGKRTSYIGVATSSSVEGPWENQGAVVKTSEGDGKTVNAIDPDIVFDKNGQPWMVYGSYFGGIFILKIDAKTGKPVNSDEEGTLIAQRKDMNFGIEGPEIIYNRDTGYYYLAVSYGWLEDTYNVRTARSKDITGPYLDYNNRDMVDLTDESFNTGVKIVGAYTFEGSEGWQGTGHSAWLLDDGKYFLTHNARSGQDIYWSHLHVRQVVWSEEGWPLALPERYAGEAEQVITEDNIAGTWEKVLLPRYDDSLQGSTDIRLLPDGKIDDGQKDSKSSWKLTGKNQLAVSLHDPDAAPGDFWTYSLKVVPGWDWENWNGTLLFTGMDQEGTVLWGKKKIEK